MRRILIVLSGLFGFGVFVLFITVCSYVCSYKLSLNKWLDKSNPTEKKIDPLTSESHISESKERVQVLLFLGDTLNIIRKDTIMQHIVDRDFSSRVERQKNGVLTFSGVSWYGRKDFKIKIEGRPLVVSIISEPNPDELACALYIHF